MLKIKTFSRMINTGNSQGEVDVIDYNLNEYIKQNNISYSNIKRFEITKLESRPSTDNGTVRDGELYLIYTLIIEK